MDTEYEIKVLDIDAAALVSTLKARGFQAQPPQAFRRYVYDLPDNNAWIRLRTDGQKTTLTYKNYTSDAIDGVYELEFTVGDFHKAHQLLELSGVKAARYQENRRQSFTKDQLEISIDEWPHIPAYAEIEGPDAETVKLYLQALDLAGHETTSAPPSAIYEHYGKDLNSFDHLSF